MLTFLDFKKKIYIVPGPPRKVPRRSGITHSPLPTPPGNQKSRFCFVESGTSDHYYQVKASSIFVFPRANMVTKIVKILVRVTLAPKQLHNKMKSKHIYTSRYQKLKNAHIRLR